MRKYILFASVLLSTVMFNANADSYCIYQEFEDFAELGYGTPGASTVNASNFYPGVYVARASTADGVLSQVTPATGVVSDLKWGKDIGLFNSGGFHVGLTPLQHTYFIFYAEPGDLKFYICGDTTANSGSLYVLSAKWNGSAFELDTTNPIASESFESNTYPKTWTSKTYYIKNEGWVAVALDTFKFDNLYYRNRAYTAVGSLMSTWGYPIDGADVNVYESGEPYVYSTPVKIDGKGQFEIEFHHLKTIDGASAHAPARAAAYSLSTEAPASGYSVCIHRADFNAPMHIPFSTDDADSWRYIELGKLTMNQGTMTGTESAEVESAVSVYASGSDIIIRGSYESAQAYTLSGSGTGLTSLPAGIYVVRVDGVAHKVAIR